MADQTVFVVQAFEMRRNRIVPTTKEQVKNEMQALRQAERTAERKGGAIALQITVDGETGEVGRTHIVARYGEIPENLDELMSSS
jgi:hypothetical protein